MSQSRFITLAFCVFQSVYALSVKAQNGTKPNIIIILADDIGYGDLGGFYGGIADTPNLNRLAEKGMLFTDFHSNGAMCSPTRAALLTGRYQQRVGIEDPLPGHWQEPGTGSVNGISSNAHSKPKTIADYLKGSGYVTAFFGKWHLGNHPKANPTKFGFDEFRGLTSGCGDYFSKIDRYGYQDWWHNGQLSFQKGYTTDLITENGINFIEKNKNQPFFLYLAHLGVHFPWQSPEDGKLQTRIKGEDFTSNKPGAHSKLGPHQPKDVPKILKEMIQSLDQNIGRLVEYLEAEGLDKNTLIFFTSDNGQYLDYDGKTWPKVGSNGVLRGEKGDLYEGGHRVPAIAYWPGKIPGGAISNETLMTFDILPTVLSIIETPLPQSNGPTGLDGESFLEVMTDQKALTERILYWKTPEAKAARKGDWKFVQNELTPSGALYNLKTDLSESKDLKAEKPAVYQTLLKSMEKWGKELEVTRFTSSSIQH
ncbi:sulfatase-like hydrolase/transferase [uncultured Cyclobacterium sp.]|uniref:sulfatase-like hydrolase/transferase n=1 Tax=uncultured Cyclobacterium sp. TaxID=453820 RepID=UPI0030EC51A4|tara:strand:+ start:39691 stop:41130 length:1440 start_codon:yes stop_codon:yes gene_type:complete